MNTELFAGIDVSAASLELAVINASQAVLDRGRFKNTPAGRSALLRRLKKYGAAVHACLEPTGRLHERVLERLTAAEFVTASLVNGAATSSFAKSLLGRAKTDRCDALLLAQYARTQRPPAWQPPRQVEHDLRCISRRICDLVDRCVALDNKHYSATKGRTPRCVINDINAEKRQLQRRIERLRAAAHALIDSDAQLSRHRELYTSMPGIAAVIVIPLLGELCCLPPDLLKKSWIAAAGLDPRPCESGSSLNRPRHISKLGNARIRRALLVVAWVAIQHCPQISAYRDKVYARTNCKMQALVAVMRKLLQALWGMTQTDTPFNPELFCQT